MPLPSVHLDLGCGPVPRNPYQRERVIGLDIRANEPREGVEFAVANLIVDPIPFPDDTFGSVSAYDFIEHIPRMLPTPDGRGTTLPFIRFMNEVWRVLAPGGRFYALTPAYPAPQAFQDPTHVNFISDATHSYFVGPAPYGSIYGFVGDFILHRVERVIPNDSLAPGKRTFKQAYKRWRYGLRNRLTHLVWELEAVKPVRR